MMNKFFLFFLLIFSSGIVVSDTVVETKSGTLLNRVPALDVPNCFAGDWQLDTGRSDNLQRIKDKLLRKYKREQQFVYRPKAENNPEASLPTGMPAFVFLKDPLSISIEKADIVLMQKAVKRRVNTSGKPQALSLKNLNNQGGVTVAGWEEKMLVIETTAMDGTLVKEYYQLLSDDHLLVVTNINTTVAKPIDMEKDYQRESTRPENCIIPDK